MKQEIIRLLERAKEDGRTIGDVLAEVRGITEPVAASAEPIGYISETGFRNLVSKRDVTTISPTVASKYRIAPRIARCIPLYAAPVAAQAPAAAGDALDAARYRGFRNALMSRDMTWGDAICTALKKMDFDPDSDAIPTAQQVDDAFDAAIAAQRKGDA